VKLSADSSSASLTLARFSRSPQILIRDEAPVTSTLKASSDQASMADCSPTALTFVIRAPDVTSRLADLILLMENGAASSVDARGLMRARGTITNMVKRRWKRTRATARSVR